MAGIGGVSALLGMTEVQLDGSSKLGGFERVLKAVAVFIAIDLVVFGPQLYQARARAVRLFNPPAVRGRLTWGGACVCSATAGVLRGQVSSATTAFSFHCTIRINCLLLAPRLAPALLAPPLLWRQMQRRREAPATCARARSSAAAARAA